MSSLRSIPLTVIFKFYFILSLCQAIQLGEIRPGKSRAMAPRGLGKRDMSLFELKNTETFLWGAKGKLPNVIFSKKLDLPGALQTVLMLC